MPKYVDGFVLPVPKKNLKAYRRLAQKAGNIWSEHGALEYRECAGDDLKIKGVVSFAGRSNSNREKRYSSLGSFTSRARIAIASMQK